MAVAIGIWLALLGYTVAWAGWRNLGITYSPQSDGSVVPSAPPLTLLDAFTCREPAASAAAPSSSGPSPATPAAPAAPNLAPEPVPVPRPGGIFAPIAVPRPLPAPHPRPPGFPLPPPVPHPGGGVLQAIEAGLQSLLKPVLAGLRL